MDIIFCSSVGFRSLFAKLFYVFCYFVCTRGLQEAVLIFFHAGFMDINRVLSNVFTLKRIDPVKCIIR